jgi:DNA-binding NarL/FixJ family response regulator
MIKILIADDHPLFREGLKKTLSEEADLNVCCEAQDSNELSQKLRVHQHGVVIVDINMPGRSGLEVLKEIRTEYPKLPVLVLSMYPEDRFAVRAIRDGAAGYLTKETVPNQLVKAIREVTNGKKYITPSVAEKLALEIEAPTDKPLHESLSNREYQLLCSIASGKSMKVIAEQLCISVNTVKSYRARLLQKMNLKTNVELTQYALRNKLVD